MEERNLDLDDDGKIRLRKQGEGAPADRDVAGAEHAGDVGVGDGAQGVGHVAEAPAQEVRVAPLGDEELEGQGRAALRGFHGVDLAHAAAAETRDDAPFARRLAGRQGPRPFRFLFRHG